MKLFQTIYQFNNLAYSRSWKTNPINLLRVKKILQLTGSGRRVLDVGCYDGSISKLIKNQKNKVVGIDISSNAIKLAKKKDLEVYTADIENLPKGLILGKFDVIIAGEIIEHIFDPDTFLATLKTYLKPKGSLILTTPNLAGLGSRLSLLFGRLPWMIENDLLPGKSGHIRYFTHSELAKLLFRHNFEIEVLTTDSVGLASITIPFLDRIFPALGRILIVKARSI